MKKTSLLFLVLVIFLRISLFAFQNYSAFEAVNLIEKEYQDRKISLDQRCLFLIQSLRQKENLPERFKVFKAEELECGTPLIIEVQRNWDKLSSETKEQINSLLQRLPKNFTYWTTHFAIHYDTSSVLPYPVYHPSEDFDPPDGVPDYVNRVGEYMERSWYVEIDSMGYYPPPFDGTDGGDSLYDVYIDAPYGYTAGELPSSQYPDRPYAITSYIDIGNDLRIDRYPDDPLPFCKATCCHELFHACQFVFTGQIWEYPEDYTSWLYESSSNWIEETVYDELNDVYYYLNSYLPVSYQSLYYTSSRHMYASWIWNQYLSENYGKNLLYSIWLKYMQVFACAAVDSVLHNLGTSMNDQFQEFAVWNWFTNYRDDGNHYSEGANFFLQDTVVYTAIHQYYPGAQTITTQGPESYAANYILFKTNSADTGTYKLTFSGADTHYVYGVNLILHKPTGSSYLKMNLNPNQTGELSIPTFKSYDQIIMVVTHLFNFADRFEPAGYSYNLSKQGSYTLGDVNLDEVIDIGDIVYLINYVFYGGTPPQPTLAAGDVNCDLIVDIGDIVFLINYVFYNGAVPVC
jgi:hypothetical protein